MKLPGCREMGVSDAYELNENPNYPELTVQCNKNVTIDYRDSKNTQIDKIYFI